MEERDGTDFKRLLGAIFGERPYGLYPYIIESDKAVSIEQVVQEELKTLGLSKGKNDSELWEKAQEILKLRFGIDGKTHTLDEIGKNMGLSRERIRQIEMKSIRRLRHPSRSRRLKRFLIPWPQERAKEEEILRDAELANLAKQGE